MSRASIRGLTLSSSPPETIDYDAENARMERVETLAHREIVTCAPRFCDWLAEGEGDQRWTAARLIAASFDLGERTGTRQTAFWALQGQIEHDYTQWLSEQEI